MKRKSQQILGDISSEDTFPDVLQTDMTSSILQESDGRTTRSQIFQLLLYEGTLTAVDVAKRLELAPEGIRRHLHDMMLDGHVQIAVNNTRNSAMTQMRGRPAKFYELTPLGRKQSGYFDSQLIIDALSTIKELAGDDALHNFAKARMDRILAGMRDSLPQNANPTEQAYALRDCLSEHGFAASVKEMKHGVELCQRHCPYDTIAEQFPIFCLSEHEVFSQFFERPIQRLATIAAGQKVCTTFIPLHALSEK